LDVEIGEILVDRFINQIFERSKKAITLFDRIMTRL